MGGFGKEFWITIVIAVPVILWTITVARSRGGNLSGPMLQMGVLVIGAIAIWRFGEQAVETATRMWEKLEPTKSLAQDPPPYELPQASLETRATLARPDVQLKAELVFCIYCGNKIPPYAIFCRRCGKKQVDSA